MNRETYNCLPDPFQILAGCTIGNKKLKIKDYGKMAVVVNKKALEGQKSVRSIRILFDPAKSKTVMPGGVDSHSHVAGAKVNGGRMMCP